MKSGCEWLEKIKIGMLFRFILDQCLNEIAADIVLLLLRPFIEITRCEDEILAPGQNKPGKLISLVEAV